MADRYEHLQVASDAERNDHKRWPCKGRKGVSILLVVTGLLLAATIYFAVHFTTNTSNSEECTKNETVNCDILRGQNVTRIEYGYNSSTGAVTTTYGYNLFHENGTSIVYLNGEFAFIGFYEIQADDLDDSKCYISLTQSITSRDIWVCVTYHPSNENGVLSSAAGCWVYGAQCAETCRQSNTALDMTHLITYFVNHAV